MLFPSSFLEEVLLKIDEKREFLFCACNDFCLICKIICLCYNELKYLVGVFMHLDSLSNNISGQGDGTFASSIQSKTKSGVFSSDLGNLNAISEQVEAISASQILHTGKVIKESSKSLRGVSAPQDHVDDESINPDVNLEEVGGSQESEDFGDFDLDDEDLLNEMLEEEMMADMEEESANIEEERVNIEEEQANIEEEHGNIEEETGSIEEETGSIEEKTAIIEKEAANKEQELVNVDEHLSSKETDLENQLIVNKEEIYQKSRINLQEGSEKVSIRKESANQLTSEIEGVGVNIAFRDDVIATIDSEVKQNIVVIDQDKSVIAEDKRAIEQGKGTIQKKSVAIAKDTGVILKDAAAIAERMKTRAENAKKLNELDADKRVDAETVNEAIHRRLQSPTFDNVRTAQGVLLRDDKEGVEELKQGIEADRQTHPEKDLTDCIEESINEWLENKVICELDEDGDLVPISPERRSQLAAILSRGVIKDIGFQVGIAQKTAEKNKAEERRSDSLKAENRDEHESIVYLVDGQRLDPQFVNTMVKVVECKLFCLDGVEIKNVNRLDEMNKENIDLIDRITEMVIMKDIIRRDVLKTELEHTELEHTTTVLDGVKRTILNKIYRFEGQDKENVCLRHPTLHPKVK